jgi:hypothetical protein
MTTFHEELLLGAALLLTLLGYGVLSKTLRGKGWKQWSRTIVRIGVSAVVLTIMLWPLIQDSLFVEHFVDEATLPGPVFMSFHLLIWGACIWGFYALFRFSNLVPQH